MKHSISKEKESSFESQMSIRLEEASDVYISVYQQLYRHLKPELYEQLDNYIWWLSYQQLGMQLYQQLDSVLDNLNPRI
jgi:hypothetical protein